MVWGVALIICMIKISKPYPRKGTETHFTVPLRHLYVISKPYPRKGTETSPDS